MIYSVLSENFSYLNGLLAFNDFDLILVHVAILVMILIGWVSLNILDFELYAGRIEGLGIVEGLIWGLGAKFILRRIYLSAQSGC